MSGLPLSTDSAKVLDKARAVADTSVVFSPPEIDRPAFSGSGMSVLGVVHKYRRDEMATVTVRRANSAPALMPITVPTERSVVDRALGVVRVQVLAGRKATTRLDRTTDLGDEDRLPTARVAALETGRVRHLLRPGKGAPTRCSKPSDEMTVWAASAVPMYAPDAWCARCTR